MSEEMQRKMQADLDGFKAVQKEYKKGISTRQQLDAQLKENEVVKEELDLLPNEATVYKSVGPVLIKTDLIEAKQNVTKRIDYIGKELKRIDELLLSLEKKEDAYRETLMKMPLAQQVPSVQ